MLIKISQSCLAAVGAKTADEFPDKLAALLNSCTTLTEAFQKLKTGFESAQSDAATFKSGLDSANETIKAQAEEIKNLKSAFGNPSTLTEAKIKEIATEAATVAGSKEAMKAIGSTGAGAPPAPPANSGGTNATNVQQLNAAGKFEEAWAADKNIQAEFPEPKGYAAFMRAQNKNQIRIATR